MARRFVWPNCYPMECFDTPAIFARSADLNRDGCRFAARERKSRVLCQRATGIARTGRGGEPAEALEGHSCRRPPSSRAPALRRHPRRPSNPSRNGRSCPRRAETQCRRSLSPDHRRFGHDGTEREGATGRLCSSRTRVQASTSIYARRFHASGF